MKIEQKESGRVKITLNTEDMKRYDITFAELDYSRIDTKRIVWELLSKARNETGFEFCGGNLLVEAFPEPDGGCVLYFSSVAGNSRNGRLRLCRGLFGPYIFKFEDCGDMMNACFELKKSTGKHILKSELYENEGKYYLAVYAASKLDPFVQGIVSEYGYSCGEGRMITAVAEHGKILASPNAIDTVTCTSSASKKSDR